MTNNASERLICRIIFSPTEVDNENFQKKNLQRSLLHVQSCQGFGLINDWLRLLRSHHNAYRVVARPGPHVFPSERHAHEPKRGASAGFRKPLFKPHILRRTTQNRPGVG
jgi:hypothetical protein